MYLLGKKNIKWGKVLLAAIAFLAISFIVRQIESLTMMRYYLIPEYFPVWSKLMMPKAGPPPASFFVISLLFTLLTGIVLAGSYEWIKSNLSKKFWARVIGYTEVVIVFSLVLAYLPMYLLINLPEALIISWFISGAVAVFLGSIVFVKILK